MLPTITLTTDFGRQDSYVAEVYGQILRLCPAAKIIDLSHEIPPGDVLHAAQLLAWAVPAFPTSVIHAAIVDPGVGTDRRRIIVEAWLPPAEQPVIFVGPDNGLFTLLYRRAEHCRAYEIDLERLPRGSGAPPLSTFDGRDVFAPAAALLASGRRPEHIGRPLGPGSAPLVELPSFHLRVSGSEIEGEITYIDRYGNLITNITAELLKAKQGLKVAVGSRSITTARNYTEIPPGEVRALLGSRGTLELAAGGQSAQQLLGASIGERVRVLLQS